MAQGVSRPASRLGMRGIRKRFGATLALGGVDLDVAAGEVLALVGENGAGKSTLMKILSGAERPDEGTMELDGEPYRPRDPIAARHSGVAMIYQELSLAPHLTVEENVFLGIEPGRLGWLNRREMRARVVAALTEMGHGSLDPGARVGSLPPAARQVVEIARALVVNAKVLVFDEPTSSLAAEDVEKLFALIRRLKTKGLAIVYISHFLEEVQALADRYVVLRDGHSVGGGAMAGTTAETIISLMVGRELKELFPRQARQRGEAILELAGLAGASKPSSASLTLHRGEVVGIAGLIGAGRTELLRALFGLDEIRSGRVKLGIYEGGANPHARWREGMGLVSEDRKGEGLALSLSIADNLTLSRLDCFGPLGWIAPKRQKAATSEWVGKFSIKCREPSQKIGELSGGNQQKVAIARLLHHDVDVLLLDEPTRGIDVGSKAEIYRWIDDLASGRAGGRAKAVLLVSSYLPEILGVSDRVAVMTRGALGPCREVREVNERSLMKEAVGS